MIPIDSDRRAVPPVLDRRRVERGIEDDLAWLRRVLGIADDDSVHDSGERRREPTLDYLARPAFEDLRFLVPTGPPAAAAAALRRHDDDRSLRRRAAGTGGRALARLGLLGLVPGRRIQLPRFALTADLERALGEPTLLPAVTLGGRRRNRKPVLQLITPGGRIVGYAKVGWSPLTTDLVRNEADVLTAIETRLPRWFDAPAVIHRQDFGCGHVVVLTAVDTTPPSPVASLRASADRSTGHVAEIVETIAALTRADDNVPSRRRVESLGLFTDWRDLGVGRHVDLDRLRSRHAATELEVGLWHGDLTPWNLSSRARSVTLWDWEFAGDGRPVGFDALHYFFERQRRARAGSSATALQVTISEAPALLETVLGAVDAETVAATVDLYLCELIAREVRLTGQRWNGGRLADLGPVAASLLASRTERRRS